MNLNLEPFTKKTPNIPYEVNCKNHVHKLVENFCTMITDLFTRYIQFTYAKVFLLKILINVLAFIDFVNLQRRQLKLIITYLCSKYTICVELLFKKTNTFSKQNPSTIFYITILTFSFITHLEFIQYILNNLQTNGS